LLRRLLRATQFSLLALCSTAAFALDPDIAVSVSQIGEAFIVEAKIDVTAPLRTTWDVLTDFDRMSTILSNLTSSRIVRRDGQTLTVRQEGVAKVGPLSFPFESEREIRLEPMRRILARQLSGTGKRMESLSSLTSTERGTHVDYRAEMVPDSVLARMFGAAFVHDEVEGQFRAMATEMAQRQKRAAAAAGQPAATQ
jgi:hypothetical protein